MTGGALVAASRASLWRPLLAPISLLGARFAAGGKKGGKEAKIAVKEGGKAVVEEVEKLFGSKPPRVVAKDATTGWTQDSRRTGVIAVKKGMMTLYDAWGAETPVTALQLDHVTVVSHKTLEKDNYSALQIGAGPRKEKNVNKPLAFHYKASGTQPRHILHEFRVTPDAFIPVGTEISAAHFVPGQFVDIAGYTIGKGFQGVMKRHGFGGLPASHGVSVSHRSHGATGSRQDPGRVFKNKKMAGRMGGERRTQQNLQVFKVDTLLNLIYVRGSIPGSANTYVYVSDSIKKNFDKSPPFPTLTEEQKAALPRELVMTHTGADPLLEEADL